MVPNQILFFYSRRTKSLPSADFELDPSPKDARLVNAFIRGRSSEKTDPADQTLPLYNNDDPGGTLQQQMIRSKDTVNQVCLMYKKPFFFKRKYMILIYLNPNFLLTFLFGRVLKILSRI